MRANDCGGVSALSEGQTPSARVAPLPLQPIGAPVAGKTR